MLMTEFNIDIAKEVWQEEAREDAREEFQAEMDAKDAENKKLEAEIAELKAMLAKQDK